MDKINSYKRALILIDLLIDEEELTKKELIKYFNCKYDTVDLMINSFLEVSKDLNVLDIKKTSNGIKLVL